ncbi:MAG TPA: hypothetical protein VF014_06645 [Casimicrobiaceae bacterium]|nr:hypothetical protein [Casimicrobiaceae bacterium]
MSSRCASGLRAGVAERLSDPEPGLAYPRLIEATGRCPPEDVGGPCGYADLLDGSAIRSTNAMTNQRVSRRQL